MSDPGRSVRSAWRRGVAAGLLSGAVFGSACAWWATRPGPLGFIEWFPFWIAAAVCLYVLNALRPREVRERTPWLVQKYSGLEKPRLRLLWYLGTGIAVLGLVSVIVCGLASFRWGWLAGSWPIPLGLLVMVVGVFLALPAGKVLGFDK